MQDQDPRRQARPAASRLAVAAAGNRRGLRIAKRLLVIGLVLGLVVWALGERLAGIDPDAVADGLGRIAPSQWLIAALFTCISFWAVGRYDRVVHRLLGTGVAPGPASRAGITAIAIGQTVGFGLVTGALLRWRLLGGVTLAQATRIAVVLALSFLAALAVIAAVAVLLTGPQLGFSGGAGALACVVLVGGLALPLLAVFPPPALARRGLRLPPLAAMGSILLLTLIDVGAAALAFQALMPADTALAPELVLTAFLLALGAGIVTGTPGGVGPFEASLLIILPVSAETEIVSAILGFRLIYYALPALIAAGYALTVEAISQRGPDADCAPPIARAPQSSPAIAQALPHARRAEAQLVHDTGRALWCGAVPVATLARAGGVSVMLGDLWRAAPTPAMLRHFQDTARTDFHRAMIYKCGSRMAATARRAGWQVVSVAREAWVDPVRFDAATPACRQLRRKLRKVEAAGVSLSRETVPRHPGELARVAAAWAAASGGERGFSMGRMGGASLCHGLTFVARDAQGEALAFVTFHAVAHEWTLDLIRYRPDTPDGVIPALVVHAIGEARASGIPRLSLAAVPALDAALPTPMRPGFRDRSGASGLARFKGLFDPQWETLYAAAPTGPALAQGLAATGWAVMTGC